MAQARANVASAQANVSAAQSRLATVLAGAKPEDISVAEAQLETARVRLAQVEAGRPEDVRAAEATVASARTRLEPQSEGRLEDVLAAQSAWTPPATGWPRWRPPGARGRPRRRIRPRLRQGPAGHSAQPPPPARKTSPAQATLDQARTRLSQVLDGGAGQGVTQRPLPGRPGHPPAARRAGPGQPGQGHRRPQRQSHAQLTLPAAAELVVTQAQIDLQIARNDPDKARNTGPSDWEVRLLQEAFSNAQAPTTAS